MYEEISISVEQASDAKVLIISAAARLAGMHPQTLRQYDRLGLVSPTRTAGKSRRYSMRDVVQLREIARLGGEGVSLEGVKRILSQHRALVHNHGARLVVAVVVRALVAVRLVVVASPSD